MKPLTDPDRNGSTRFRLNFIRLNLVFIRVNLWFLIT